MIIDEWNKYRVKSIHPKAGLTQVLETKHAFYWGASRVIALISKAIMDTDSVAYNAIVKEMNEYSANFEKDKM